MSAWIFCQISWPRGHEQFKWPNHEQPRIKYLNLGPANTIKFLHRWHSPWVKCPTYVQPPPLRLNTDRCITVQPLLSRLAGTRWNSLVKWGTVRPSFICDTNILHVIYIVNVWDFMFVLETFSNWNKNHEIPQYPWLLFCHYYVFFGLVSGTGINKNGKIHTN